MTNALFLASSVPDRGVFESQVLEYGRFMRTLGVEFRYLMFEGVRGWLRTRRTTAWRLTQLSDAFDTRIDVYGVPLPLSSLGLMVGTRVVTRAVAGAGSRPLLLQARGLDVAWMALEVRRRLPNVVVLYDARADAVAEARMTAERAVTSIERLRWRHRARQLERLERRVCAEADHVLTVSSALQARVCAVGSRPLESVTVVPCCVDPSRFVPDADRRRRTRRRLGLEDRLVFVYAGSLQSWQATERLVPLITRIRSHRARAHLLVLSEQSAALHELFAALVDAGACTIVDCPYSHVGEYLNASDVGLLLREDDPVNRVACPIKFAEYQAAGLPVVATPRIGDVTAYLEANGFGVVIDLQDPPDTQAHDVLRAIETHDWTARRGEIREATLRRFSRESYRSTYIAILHRLGVERGGRASPISMQVAAGVYEPA